MRIRNWNTRYTRGTERDLRSLANATAYRITGANDKLVGTSVRGDVRRVQGHDDEWRLRVGSWRVGFTANFEERGIVYLTQFDIELAAVVIPSPPKVGEESRAYVFVKPDTP